MNKKKIAIIGSGISGLSASLFLSKEYEVHLFEKNNILGGHTRTIKFNDEFKNPFSIDTGFIVYNDKNYPYLKSFLNYLDVITEDSNMSFSVSCKKPNFEYGGSSINSFFAQRKNLFSVKYYFFLLEIIKFYKTCKELNINDIDTNMTVKQFLQKKNFSKKIRDFHIYPMISSIWSSKNKDTQEFPFIHFLNFFINHNLFELKKRPQWKFISGGSYKYVEALIKKKLFHYYLNFQIKKIKRKDNKIIIVAKDNSISYFDKIIFANHADQALKLLDQPTENESNILSNFNYTQNHAYLHSDNQLMPKSDLAWSSWNFLQNLYKKDSFSLTYWMNNLQKIKSSTNYFVSINPPFIPKNVINEHIFEHPIFNMKTLNAQKNLALIQGQKNTFYCGSYCGYGFHEDGIQSAAYIAKKLNVRLPWKNEDKSLNRLNY